MPVPIRTKRAVAWSRLVVSLGAVAVLLASCEDEGNPGDDNILTGASLVVILLIVVVVGLWLMRRRRG